MQKNILYIAIALGLLGMSCSEEGFIKVFKCPDAKPFFNTVDSRCYSSQANAEEVNKVINAKNEKDKPKDPLVPDDKVDPVDPGDKVDPLPPAEPVIP